MKAPSTLGLLLGAAALFCGCVSNYYGNGSTYSNMVMTNFLETLNGSSEVDGGWSGSMGGSSSYGSATGWSYDSSWSGDVSCDDAYVEQLGQDLFDGLRMDIFARGFEVITDGELTFIDPHTPGANPAITMQITHRSARSEGTVELSAYAVVGDELSVKIAFTETSF